MGRPAHRLPLLRRPASQPMCQLAWRSCCSDKRRTLTSSGGSAADVTPSAATGATVEPLRARHGAGCWPAYPVFSGPAPGMAGDWDGDLASTARSAAIQLGSSPSGPACAAWRTKAALPGSGRAVTAKGIDRAAGYSPPSPHPGRSAQRPRKSSVGPSGPDSPALVRIKPSACSSQVRNASASTSTPPEGPLRNSVHLKADLTGHRISTPPYVRPHVRACRSIRHPRDKGVIEARSSG